MLRAILYYHRARKAGLPRRVALRRMWSWYAPDPLAHEVKRIENQVRWRREREAATAAMDDLIADVWCALWYEKPRRAKRLVKQWRKEQK